MTIDEAIVAAVEKATRKKKTTAELGTKYNALLAAADRLQKEWSRASDWDSLYDVVACGTVTATDTFDLDSTIRKVSQQEGDYVSIVKNTQSWLYNLVPINRYRSFIPGGSDPWTWGTETTVSRQGRTLKFPNAFTSTSAQLGGTIYVPGYKYAEDAVGTDDVQVDDPLWLVDMLAADYVRNDKTRQYMEPNFIQDAQNKMAQMIRDNGSQLEEVINAADMWGSGETW